MLLCSKRRVEFGGVNLSLFLFFTHKTAYEMRISDWSSDVCSSDLGRRGRRRIGEVGKNRPVGALQKLERRQKYVALKVGRVRRAERKAQFERHGLSAR